MLSSCGAFLEQQPENLLNRAQCSSSAYLGCACTFNLPGNVQVCPVCAEFGQFCAKFRYKYGDQNLFKEKKLIKYFLGQFELSSRHLTVRENAC